MNIEGNYFDLFGYVMYDEKTTNQPTMTQSEFDKLLQMEKELETKKEAFEAEKKRRLESRKKKDQKIVRQTLKKYIELHGKNDETVDELRHIIEELTGYELWIEEYQ